MVQAPDAGIKDVAGLVSSGSPAPSLRHPTDCARVVDSSYFRRAEDSFNATA